MKLKKKCQSAVLSFLERRYPGIRDIVNLLGKYFIKQFTFTETRAQEIQHSN